MERWAWLTGSERNKHLEQRGTRQDGLSNYSPSSVLCPLHGAVPAGLLAAGRAGRCQEAGPAVLSSVGIGVTVLGRGVHVGSARTAPPRDGGRSPHFTVEHTEARREPKGPK